MEICGLFSNELIVVIVNESLIKGVKKVKSKVLIAILAAGLCASFLFGCSSKEDTTEKIDVEEAEEEEEELKVIGTKADGENIYKVTLENNTGQDIIGLSIKDSSMESYSDNMLAEDDPFVQGEKRELYYDSTAAKEAAANQTGDESTPVVTPQYDMQLTFADQSVLVLTAFPFDDTQEGQICYEDEVAFL